MYSDVEADENVDEDFLSALALLHSADVDSADKLRRMLDLSIEKKLGVTTKRKRDEQIIACNHRATRATEIVGQFEDQLRLMETLKREDFHDRLSPISTHVYNYCPIVEHVSRSSSELCTTELDDSLEDEEIPRISIPDDSTSDGVVCKVCNGDKLGPLILLECQECQEVYHPLCHQPPVVDIDVYDPRLVWRCGKCIDTSDSETAAGAPLVVTLNDDGIEVSADGNRATDSDSVVYQATKCVREKLGGKEEATKPCCFARTRRRPDNNENSSRKTSRSSQKSHSNPRASSLLRKRVGSRLSVTRVSSAN